VTKAETLAFRIRVDLDLLDLVKNEVTKMQKFLKQEKTPLTPDRRSAVFNALAELQGPKP
jgi:hypothetical protein